MKWLKKLGVFGPRERDAQKGRIIFTYWQGTNCDSHGPPDQYRVSGKKLQRRFIKQTDFVY